MLTSAGCYIKDVNGKRETINEDSDLMGLAAESEELEIFDTESMMQLIQFKWEMYARKHHLFGCFMHMVYVQCLINYTNLVYIMNEGSKED